MKWIKVEDDLPEESVTVWAINDKEGLVWLACLVHDEEWLWAESNGTIYADNGTIVSECELYADYDVTHWQALPKLPIKQG